MSVLSFPARNNEGWFIGVDGRRTTYKHNDEKRTYTFRFGDLLDGDTIDTATWTMSGAVNEASSNTDTVVLIQVSGVGTGDLIIETTSGETLEFRFRWASSDGDAQDY
jgi:hypothetical protein